MKIRDKELKKDIDVRDKECPKRDCYWPRQDPGAFSPGAGYSQRDPHQKKITWICGTRDIRGCPVSVSELIPPNKET